MTTPTTLTVQHVGNPERLDRVVTALVEAEHGYTRSQVARWIEEERVTVGGSVESRPGAKVVAGQEVVVVLPAPQATHLAPYTFALDILFEDKHLIVINKPAGLSMHPGAGNRETTLANAVVAHVGGKQNKVGESDRPGIVHRLDKDTTGVVVIAKSTRAHSALAEQFSERSVVRAYTALVFSTPRAKRTIQATDKGEIVAAIARHPGDRKRMAIVEDGKPAKTRWKVLDRFAYGTLLECSLATGRTHQIRVHMEHIGSPVIGDLTYGDFSGLPRPLADAAKDFGRQALHATTLEFTHPIGGERLAFAAPLPNDLVTLIDQFKGADEP